MISKPSIRPGLGRDEPPQPVVETSEASGEPFLDELEKQVKLWIQEHPAASLTAAVVFGATLGWLIKNRR